MYQYSVFFLFIIILKHVIQHFVLPVFEVQNSDSDLLLVIKMFKKFSHVT